MERGYKMQQELENGRRCHHRYVDSPPHAYHQNKSDLSSAVLSWKKVLVGRGMHPARPKAKKRQSRAKLLLISFLCIMLITAFLFFVTFAHHIEDDTFFAPDNHGRFFVVFPQEEQGGGLPNSSSLPPVLRSTANEKEKQQQHLTIHNGNYNAVSTMTTNALPQPQDDLWHVSVVILTFKKHDALAKLLSTVISQKGVNLEIIIVDNGCKPATQQVVQDAFNMTLNGTQQQEEEGTRKKIKYEYVQMCHNPGYGLGNNEGVKKASNETKWVLFLNDDIVLKDDDFIHNMFRLGDSHRETAAAVGCVLTTPKGDELIEAGSIIWNDGSAASFGRGRKDLRAPEFSYPRPVDYVSGACLMVDKSVFLNYGGFDHEDYVNYYEDTDLQMHIQHDLGKEVWVQPLSVALHEEHGSLGNKESLELMNKCHKIFFKKWREKLQKYHLPPPVNLPKIEQELAFLRASDVRGRKSDKASILYVDGDVPNKQMGSGFGRAFDNLSILASLGHRVTVVSLNPVTDGWCDVSCLDRIRQLGIEVITDGWGKFFPAKDRFDFYDIVIVSRPGTFLFTYKKLQKLFTKSPFTLIYDSEALTYRRDETLQHLVKEDGIMFPGMKHFEANLKLGGFFSKQQEITMLSMSDQIVTVSVQETKLVKRQISNSTSAETIGHIMDLNAVTTNSFSQRSGILFLGSFHDNMYYNGDAIWYFLDKIYPLVLKNHDDSPATEPIRLTIAGRDIPLELIKYIAKNATLARHVTFLESPENIDDLMEDTRLFIAPHQYGSGIQYKVSEAFAFGVPVILSGLTAEAFGLTKQDKIGCIGTTVDSFKDCILRLYHNETDWKESRENAMEFIRSTHSRDSVVEKWSTVINKALATGRQRHSMFQSAERKDEVLKHKFLKTKVPDFQLRSS